MSELLHVGPIVLTGIFGALIVIERTGSLFFVYTMHAPERFFSRLRQLLLNHKMEEAVELCHSYRHKLVGHIAWQAVLKADQPDEIIENAVSVAVSQMIQKAQKRTSYIATVANVATLLGLFGTILGLIQSFEAIGSASAQQRSALLTAGISTAMNATLLGLGVAIPCLIFYGFLAAKTNRLVAEAEQAALTSMQVLKEYYYSSAA